MSLWERLAEAIEIARRRTLGALLDALSRAQAQRDEASFSIALIALSAKMAKADGVVTDDEIAAFRRFFNYPDSEAAKVRMIYDLAQQDVAGFEHYLSRVARIYSEAPQVLEDVLDCLYLVALADGVAHPSELALLEEAGRRFGLGASSLRRIRAAHLGLAQDDPYVVLDLDADASLDVVKARYRALMRQHHPDAMMARGVPASLVVNTSRRAAAINDAYERILNELRATVGQ